MEGTCAAGAAGPNAGSSPNSTEVFLSPTYVLRSHHVVDALKGVPADANDVTVWIHSSTLGIEKSCFEGMKCVSRILVCDPEPHAVDAVVLCLLIAKLRAYEPDVVDFICGLVQPSGGDYEMHHIGDDAFRSCSALREVVLPRSITTVGNMAFMLCTSLTSVTLPNSLTHVGKCAFKGCTSLTTATLPNSLTRVRGSAFSDCTSLTSVTLPNSLTHVDGGTFRGCTSLTSVTLPNSLTHVGYCAFMDCTSLTSVTLPNSLTHVGYGAFVGCTSLPSVTLPNSLSHVGDNMFPRITTIHRSARIGGNVKCVIV
jgi:hypothetical protein